MNTNAYLSFKGESERLTNLAVLFSHAVPVLRQVLASPTLSAQISLKPADNFPHDRSDGPALAGFAAAYDRDLANLVLLSVFSYFEAYVRCAIQEIYELQGGDEAFLALSRKRVTRHWKSAPPAVLEAKRKLQTRERRDKADKYRKYAKVLAAHNFAFPPDLLAVYGAQQLARKLDTKGRSGMRASEIPDLLTEALLLDVNKAERVAYQDVRLLRNRIAHGGTPALSVHQAIKRTTFLREWAGRIDHHIAEYFLVLAKYAQ